MRLAYIAAGAGGMYCGSCIHDNTLAAALLAGGHDVALVPTYTPIRTDEEEVAIDRIFFGAVNVYLQQKFSLFRHTPAAIDRWLDRPGLLGWVSRLGASTDASRLGDLTLSVLRGEEGRQRKELTKLVDWLEDLRPELVQLTNSMFLGFAREIKRRLGCPVVCGLTGEDLFIDGLAEPARSEVRAELRRRAQDADGFLATSRFYADFMQEYLQVPAELLHVVPLGIDLEQLGARPTEPPGGEPLVIGYLARICPEKGTQLLVEAFRRLVARYPERPLRLKIAGYVAARDLPFVDELQQQVAAAGLGGAVEFLGEVDRRQKLDFLTSIDILSVPTTFHEPKGLYLLEALAHGVPVVQPRHGAFTELIEATGGGTLVEPGSAQALAEGLAALVVNAPLRREMGRRGRAAVERQHHHHAMAERTLAVYEKVLRRARREATR